MSVEVETDDITLDKFFDTDGEKYATIQERAAAACNSAAKMFMDGADIRPTPEEKQVARDVFKGKQKVTKQILHNPAVALHLQALLSQYDHEVVRDVAQLRLYVKNRLLLESDNPDAKVRLRALEMLGKIGEVGLFTERSEITVTHKPTAELEAKLQEKLGKIIDMGAAEVVDATEVMGGVEKSSLRSRNDNAVEPITLPNTLDSTPLRPDFLLS